jgi:two-component system OmpR family sensor kinase
MRAPSLRWRLAAVTTLLVAIIVVSLDAFIYLNLRDELEDTLAAVLSTRVAVAVELADRLDDAELAGRLTELGIPAIVRDAQGRELRADPRARRFGEVPPGTGEQLGEDQPSTTAPLDDGGSVTVFVSRGGVERTLERVLLLEVVGSVAALALSAAVLAGASRQLLRPIDRVVQLARRIADGRSSGRLRPERTDTELGRMAAAFDEMLDSLESALHEARTSEAASRRFLADAAHQLRTPVAGARASAEALLRDPDVPQREELLSNIARENARAGRLIATLLRIAELDREVPLQRRRISLRALVEQEAARFGERAPHVDVRVVAAGDPPVEVATAPDELREALTNLLDNAVRHALREVVIELRRGDREVAIAVTDDGPGLPEGSEQRVFERFVSLDGRGGTGLGLSVARDIARRLGGDLRHAAPWFVLSMPAGNDDIT